MGDTSGQPQRLTLAAEELRAALDAYSIAKPKSAADYRRGQPDAPKALIEAQDGTRFLLKRRSPRHASRERVLASQTAMDAAALGGVPVAELQRTREGERAFFRGEHAYELFLYVKASEDDRSPRCAFESGATLARTLEALKRADVRLDEPGGHHRAGFHRSHVVETQLGTAEERCGCEDLRLPERYEQAGTLAAARIETAEPVQPLHGDWHPGNLLYEHGSCAAVLDFDAVRAGRAAEEVASGLANAALPEDLPGAAERGRIRLDADRGAAFLRGFAATTPMEPAAWSGPVPWLMLESIAAEAGRAIALTGGLGPVPGPVLLEALAASWEPLGAQAVRLVEIAVKLKTGPVDTL